MEQNFFSPERSLDPWSHVSVFKALHKDFISIHIFEWQNTGQDKNFYCWAMLVNLLGYSCVG